jgi:thioredoxin 1
MPYQAAYLEAAPERSELDATRGPLLIEFGTDWCGHCLAAQPAIHAAFAAHPDLPHRKIEDGPGRPLGRSYRVKLWPTLILLRDGQEVGRLVRPTEVAEVRDALKAAFSG